MSKRWFEGGWARDYARRGFEFYAPGEVEDGVSAEATLFLSDREAIALIPMLEAAGMLTPRLDERLRTEDLKITHRLLDLLEARHE